MPKKSPLPSDVSSRISDISESRKPSPSIAPKSITAPVSNRPTTVSAITSHPRNWSLTLWLWVLVVIAGLAVVGLGWWQIRPSFQSSDFTVTNRIMIGDVSAFGGELTYARNTITAPRTELNPINGTLYTPAQFKAFSSKPLIAVMIENQVDARPQAGFAHADMVYETLAEGGITRMMAIFWSQVNTVPKMGPVRSARNYYLELERPYDALYMHIGCASSNDKRVNACGNRYSYGIKTMDIGNSFYRVTNKFAPHNAYTSPKILYDLAKRLNRYTKPNLKAISVWEFKNDAIPTDRGKSTTAKIRFLSRLANYGLYDVEWRYDARKNVYKRYMAGKPHIDENTKQQITAKVVVVEDVPLIQTGDAKGHLIFSVVGKGDARILQDGKSYKVQWQKSDRTKREVFTAGGKPFQLNRGQIWVEIVPKGQGSVSIK